MLRKPILKGKRFAGFFCYPVPLNVRVQLRAVEHYRFGKVMQENTGRWVEDSSVFAGDKFFE